MRPTFVHDPMCDEGRHDLAQHLWLVIVADCETPSPGNKVTSAQPPGQQYFIRNKNHPSRSMSD